MEGVFAQIFYLSGAHGPLFSSLQSLIRLKLTIMATAASSGRIAVLLNVYHRKPLVLVSIVTREASSI